MRTLDAREVIAAIDAARMEEPGGALAFDGDGTLWSGDIGEDFFEALLAHGLHPASHGALVREAAEQKLDTSGGARDVAHRIHAAYLGGTFPEERVCEIMTWACAGLSRQELDAFAAKVIEAIGLRSRLHAEAIRIVEHARETGIEVLLVSASPRAIVDQAAKIVGVDPQRVLAARETVSATGVVECSVERPIPYAQGKVTRLRERVGSRKLYAVFGDNAFDVPMLREAGLPVAIRPKQRLLDRSAEVPGMVVLARA